jgi:hypothetical protein
LLRKRGFRNSRHALAGLGSAFVPERRRGIAFSIVGIVLLALNVVDAAHRGASAGNIVAIAIGAFLLFYGFILVARSGTPPST